MSTEQRHELLSEQAIAWIAGNTELRLPFETRQLVGGHSNLTILVTDAAGRRAVVRRPPNGELHAGAHDMRREYSILAALNGSAVPVPAPLAFCSDGDVADHDFYVMDFVDGVALPDSERVVGVLPDAERQRSCSASFIDTLADLHAIDPLQVGLDPLVRTGSFVERQLRAWFRSWTMWAGHVDDVRMHQLHDLLVERRPQPHALRIVHGDYGLHNVLVAADGHVAAVVDWEVCTLGDALSDLAYVLNRWATAAEAATATSDVVLPDAFGTREQALQRYVERTGADVSDLDYFVVLNHWRSACIVQGVYSRYLEGQKDASGVDLEHFRRFIGTRVDAAEAAAAAM